MSEETAVPKEVLDLVQGYEFHRPSYLRGQYNETELRREFIDPLFRALGWDIDNNQRFAEAYKEVVHEQTIKFRGHESNTKFIDYSFRLGGVMKFIVETKKPSVKIADDAKSALQVRRYAWNAKLTLNILTNFEEWAIYDCRIKPENNDPATKGRIKYFSYKDLAKEWSYLSSIFTKTAIQQGSFDAYASETKGKKGTASVDDTFLSEIEEWRDRLAKNFALRNPSLSVDELNDAVQKTIDRIIFLRICEDRGIEKYETLKEVLEGDGTYQKLCTLFLDADERYNSGIFHFRVEKDNHEKPDTYTLSLILDDKVLKDLIKRLYYPESPFEFNVIPPAILGHVYEQFLGKVIRLTEGHQAKVEYKPEVKKAGGVFYTPEYIVNYIVQHTVGELVKDKTPKEVAKLRILDPACGSGSFLLGAYKYLLEWHRDWYIYNLVPVVKEKGATSPEVKALLSPDARGAENLPVYKAANGEESRVRSDWKLTTAERKRILLNNIYGVDIDRQAVEVTKLSLLLKVLEEENEETVSKQLKLFKERALPSLHENIKCGNSLIGNDIYKDVQVTFDDPSVVKKINAFDWDVEFAEIMKGGGFDAVIGNPPYVRMELLLTQKKYFKSHYSVYQGRSDLYTYFMERGISLLRPLGFVSYIVSNKWLRATYGKPIRQLIKKKQINEIINFGDLPVFKTATTYPCIIRITNKNPDSAIFVTHIKSLGFPDLEQYILKNQREINLDDLDDSGWTLSDNIENEILNKMKHRGVSLKDYTNGNIFWGVKTGLNEAFIIDEEIKNKIISQYPDSIEIIKPFLIGKDIQRYKIESKNRYIIYTYHGVEIEKYPGIIQYLNDFKVKLNHRATRQQWYELQQPQFAYSKFMVVPKIIYLIFQVKPSFAFDPNGSYYTNNATYIIPIPDLYLLGILNSKVGWYLISKYCTQIQNGYQLMLKYFERIPIHTINPSDPVDVACHDKMIILVERMLDLNKRLPDARIDQERTIIERQIAATDKEIDELVYELYGISEEERKIVEGDKTS